MHNQNAFRDLFTVGDVCHDVSQWTSYWGSVAADAAVQWSYPSS